ncbi:putative dehydrogenase [Opitutaceae bacterium TAV1]|nr:putative dehydrogenase [Opitutaceae bacterium TAV1]
MPVRCLNTAIVGIGGFAGAHHAALLDMERAGRAKVVATCDPALDSPGVRCAKYEFKNRGVHMYRDFDDLLAAHGDHLDVIHLVSPIRFHAAHHRACVERGIACYLEKPPTLDPEELEAMIATDTGAGIKTQVGFNHIAQPWRLRLKERVLAGEFGRMRRVAFQGLWRRPLSYYRRNAWAGRLMLGDFILLDSCCGNAMAHHVHNMLFHAGTAGLMSWASPATVEALLYRANRIESPDTVFAHGILDNGVEFRLAASHACEPHMSHREVIECDNARIEISAHDTGLIHWRTGVEETIATPTFTVQGNIEDYHNHVRGQTPRPVTTLPDTRPFVHLNALLYIAAGGLRPVEPPHAKIRNIDGEQTMLIPGVESATEALLGNGSFPAEAQLPWAAPADSRQRNIKANADDVTRLRFVLQEQFCPFASTAKIV